MKINYFNNSIVAVGTAFLSIAGGMLAATQASAHHIDLGWKGSPYTLKLNKSENIGKEYNFECVPAPEFIGQTMAVIGTDNYSEWSNICPSALHAGMIGREGGFITIKIEPGKELYTATERNGIESKNAGASAIGFSFVSSSVTSGGEVTAEAQTLVPTNIDTINWKGSPYTLKLNKSENIGREYNFECVPAPEFIGQTMAVIGTDNYSEWSNICPSALHAGMIGREGGVVTMKIEPGKEFYTATERNGIESKNAGASDIGFSFVDNPVKQ